MWIASYSGELAALTAALFWACATVSFGRMGRVLHPLEMNLVKNLVAIVMLVITLAPAGQLLAGLPVKASLLFLLSGMIGLGIGDTFYFEALKHLGARRTLLLGMLSPPVTGLIALGFLGERLPIGAWLGIGSTLVGIGWVISERSANGERGTADLSRGLLFGILAALAQAIGAVLSRTALLDPGLSALYSSLVRLVGGTLMVIATIHLTGRSLSHWMPQMRVSRLWGRMMLTVFFGTYLAIWLQQISLQYTAAGIAQTLFTTSPLFVLPIAAAMGERVSPRAILGVLVALGGVGLIFGFY